ncbi:MAG: flagellar filament capping protein FliD [Lachnospiraceae bacterium]|nr:flagellar filament capping protein FliD [Lachnospiraceae bacterium]
MSISISSYSNTLGTLFSSLTSSRSSSSGSTDALGISYSDYASIRSGSYYKLLKQYYASDASESSESSTTATSEQIQSSAESLSEVTDKLLATGSSSLFKEVTTTDEDGNTTTGYDTEKISETIQSFVDSYNDLVEKAGSSDSSSITAAAASMVNYTSVNSSLLSQIGITVNSDNTLSFDADTFADADMSTVQSLFQGRGSYGYTVGVQASMINYAAAAEESKTYSSSGTYSYNYVTGTTYSTSV